MALPCPDLECIRAFLAPHHIELGETVGPCARELLGDLPEPLTDAEARAQCRDILSIVAAQGWLQYGTEDLRAASLIREAVAAANPLADAVFALQALGTAPISLGGSAELQAKWVEPARTGEKVAGFAMTEPDAGSDAGGIKTTAHREGDQYVIDGEKIFISNGGLADFYCVFASTDPDAGNRGITCLLVEADRPGLQYAGPHIMSSPHPLGHMVFQGCRVPITNRLGEEGRGFSVGMGALDRLRPGVAAAACGFAHRAIEEATLHAKSRTQFGSKIADFQLTKQKLARSAIDLAAARLLTYRAAWEKDQGTKRFTVPASMAKAFATEAAQRIIDDAIQIVGGRAVMRDHPLDRLYRTVRATRIYEGTTEIQHLIVAKAVLA